MNRTRIRALAAAAIISNSSLLPLPSAMAQLDVRNPAAPLVAKEKETCAKHLKMIYEAIQAYRKDHKDLPNWLSDLVPKYIADSALLVCPAMTRTGAKPPFPWLADPKVATCYTYQFCDGEMGSIWNGGKMKMRHWKMMQMGLVGGEVPMVRCSLHGQILSLTFSGNIFEGPSSWEDQFSDVINREEFAPRNLIPRFAAMLGRQTQNFESNPAARTSPGTANENVLVGKQAPNFKLQLLDGSPFELASFQNKNIVLLDFWATWCGPCRAAMPVLQQLAADFKDKGVLYYAVDLREKPEKVRDYLKETGLKIAVPMDSDGAIGKLYKVTGIPTLVIVGKDGTVQAVQVGFSPDLKDQLKKKLETLIAGKN